MHRTLSSAWTPFFKFFYPALGGAIAGSVLFALLAHPAQVTHFGGSRGPAPLTGRRLLLLWMVALAFCCLFGAFIIGRCLPLKRVRVDGDTFLVSNYRRTWRVPFGLVSDVTQNRWAQGRPITIRLRANVGFGSRIVFLPAVRFIVRFWREDPMVGELRHLVGLRAVGE